MIAASMRQMKKQLGNLASAIDSRLGSIAGFGSTLKCIVSSSVHVLTVVLTQAQLPSSKVIARDTEASKCETVCSCVLAPKQQQTDVAAGSCLWQHVREQQTLFWKKGCQLWSS